MIILLILIRHWANEVNHDSEVVAWSRADGEGGRVPRLSSADGIPDYLATAGNRGASILRRDDGDVTHFLLITLWDSEQAIQTFAGTPIDRARYYPEDDDFLLERESAVQHYVVSAEYRARGD
jgi:hypothetical protein